MIMWPLKTLRDNGIEDITIVSTPDGVGQIAKVLGSGHEHGCRFTYRVQDQPGGIAQALACAWTHLADDTAAVILGDNIFLSKVVIRGAGSQARTYLARVPDLSGFGVPAFHSMGDHINAVFEKPLNPPSEFAITGLYVFGTSLWEILHTVRPSNRGELEITDVLHDYAQRECLSHTIVDGFWGDAGTLEGMAECSEACRKELQK